MDYGKSGSAKPARNEPRHQERKPAKPSTPGGRATQAELLARMKAAALARAKA